MTVIRQIPWTDQPQEAVDIDWSNPITNGLVEWDIPALGPYVSIGTPTTTPTGKGMAFTGGGTSARYRAARRVAINTALPFTLFGLFNGSCAADARAYGIQDAGNFIIYMGSSNVGAEYGRLWLRLPTAGDVDLGMTSAKVFEVGIPHTFALRQTVGSPYAYASFVDGRTDVSGTWPTAPSGTYSNIQVGINGRVVSGSGFNYNASGVLLGCIWERALSDYEIASLNNNPWQIFAPRIQNIWASLLSGAYTLNAETGVYTFTGSNASLLHNYALTLESASYSLTGSNATLLKGLILDAASGSYTLTGSNATLVYNKLLNASSGSYSVTGADANLIYTPTAGAYVLNAESGAYVLTGSDVTFSYSGGTITLKAGSWIRYRIIT